ncbi:hypothetical protein BKA69DRAFT_1057494 [Paraphysoderma sedebokerense]|nr:hypothetical protein BKA69DRAFT_1057494 [Paraphysoderma sedebokerense]
MKTSTPTAPTSASSSPIPSTSSNSSSASSAPSEPKSKNKPPSSDSAKNDSKDSTASPKVPKNIFTNDGSFLERFKAMKKESEEKKNMVCCYVSFYSCHTFNSCLQPWSPSLWGF